MAQVYDRNRKRLADLIYSKAAPFTRDELIDEFRRTSQEETIAIDGYQTISMFLEELVSLRALDRAGYHRYVVARGPF